MTIKIANGAGFLGDDIDAPRRLVEAVEVDYLTLEYLAELTMSILARSREKNPSVGFAKDFLDVLRSISEAVAQQAALRIVTNAGGVNPAACARAAAQTLVDAEMPGVRIGVVSGDDLLARLDDLQASGCTLSHLDTGAPWSQFADRAVSANAYLGAMPISQALEEGARVVITGRVADASLTVGPLIHEYGWAQGDWHRLAAATVAGHLIECGAQVTGGYSTRWSEFDLTQIGYPIAEVDAEGMTIITKPPGSSGRVTRRTVIEQLVYEIEDPRGYMTPDVVADFTTVEVESIGENRVSVRGARGVAAPDHYKVSLAYRSGYFASHELLVYGSDCVEKARECGRLVFDRLRSVGTQLSATNVEVLGTGAACHHTCDRALRHADTPEVVLRLTASDPSREKLERFSQAIAPLITNGPAGLAGYASGRAIVRPVYAYWPTLVPKELVRPVVEVRTAAEWLR